MAVEKKYKKNSVKKTGNSKKKTNSTSKVNARNKNVKSSISNGTAKKKNTKTSSKVSARKKSTKTSSSKVRVNKSSVKKKNIRTSGKSRIKQSVKKKEVIENKLLIDNNENIEEIVNEIDENLILIGDTLVDENNSTDELEGSITKEDIEGVILYNTATNSNSDEFLLEDNIIIDENKETIINDGVIIDDNNKDEELILDKKENEIKNEDYVLMLDSFASDKKKKNKKTFVILVLVLAFIFILDAIFFPRIELIGEEELVISYKDKYVEPGYRAMVYKKDISNNVYVDGNVNDGVVGEYEINYYLDLLGAKLKKTRYVNVVDLDKPNITVDRDSVTVCPNVRELPVVKYSANDGYDGDITDLVIRKDSDNEILFSVSDSSDNFDFKTIKVNRVDNEKPVIKLKGSSYMFVEYGNRYIEPGYEISDNCSQFANLKVNVSGSVGMDKGTYTITYEVSDESGNKSSVVRKIVVGDKMVDNGVVNNGVIYLTFDDGPNYGTTDKILDILKEEGVKATFFVTNRGPDSLIKRMHDDGHTVALHTASHEYSYVYSSVDNYFNDLNRVRDRVKRITGVDSKIIRFPGGSSNVISRNYKVGIMTELTSSVLNQGYRYFDWNVDSKDASSARSGRDVYYNVVNGLSRNRSNVVLMHDIKNITVNGLRDIIRYGKNSGYKFDNIDMNTYMVRHSVSN